MTYDPEADAIYIRLSDSPPYEGEDAGPMTLHYDKDNRVVGIEVIGARKVLAPGRWLTAPLPGTVQVEAAE